MDVPHQSLLLQLKDATKHHNKASQKTQMYLLNQMKNINSKIDSMGQNKDALPKFYMPLKTRVDSRKMIKDVERFRSLTTDVVTPNECLPHA